MNMPEPVVEFIKCFFCICWDHHMVFVQKGFPCASDGNALKGAQMLKNSPAIQETQVQSLGQEDLPEKGMAPIFLPEDFHGQRSLVGYSPWSPKKSDTTEWLILLYTISWKYQLSLNISYWFSLWKICPLMWVVYWCLLIIIVVPSICQFKCVSICFLYLGAHILVVHTYWQV